MFAALLLAILITLAGAESYALPCGSAMRSAADVLILTIAVAFVPLFTGARIRRRIGVLGVARSTLQRYRLFRLAAPIWAAVLAPLAVYIAAWPDAAKQLLAEGWLLDELAVLLPVVTPFAAIFWSIAGIERRLLMLQDKAPPSQASLFAMQLRHYAGFLLAPILFALAVGEFAERFETQLQGREWLVPTTLLLGLVVLFPLILRRIWRTEPLEEGPLRTRLKQIAETTGMRVREILVWQTHGSFVNAAVIGFAGLARYVLLTDELIERFDDDQIESVLLHEAAHVRRRHLLWRLGLIAFPIAACALAASSLEAAGAAQMASLSPVTIAAEAADAGWRSAWTVLTPLLLLAYCGVSLCWISRLLEFDADVWACRFLATQRAQGMPEATTRYAAMLEHLALVAGVPRSKRSWLHPSIGERVALVASLNQPVMQAEPAAATRLETLLRVTMLVYIALGAVPLAVVFWLSV